MSLLEGRVAIVTGGARGIGLATTRALAAAGARVVVLDDGSSVDGRTTDASVVADVATELGERGLGLAVDVADRKAVNDAVAQAAATFGGVDIIVNNAAILRDAMMFKVDMDDFARVVEVNLIGAANVIAAAAPLLRDQAKQGRGGGSWGRIVNMSSSTGVYGNVGTASYAASKAGLIGLTRVAAMDLARSGVACNALIPFAATRITDGIPPVNDMLKAYKERALRVPAEPVADFIVALCGPDGGAITGQVIGVRGRELMLFSQVRPSASIEVQGDWLGALRAMSDRFVDLGTDLEAFNHDPVL